jgi:hypothetical protein
MIVIVYLIVSKIFMFIDYYLTFYLKILLVVFIGILLRFIYLISLNLKYYLGDRRINIFSHNVQQFMTLIFISTSLLYFFIIMSLSNAYLCHFDALILLFNDY